MKVIRIDLPLHDDVIQSLKAGDKVLFSGTIYTARDKAHELLVKDIGSGKSLPFVIKQAVLYYTGPIVSDRTGRIISAGPTTSARMDTYTEQLLAAGVRGMIGKGYRSREVIEAIRKYRAIYFSTIGGAGVYLAKRIKAHRLVAFEELGVEAVYELQVEEFPCYVTIDSKGHGIFDNNY
jgi:fumarate hydratase subunit beta